MIHFVGRSRENEEWFAELIAEYGYITFIELQKKLGERKWS